MPAFDYPTPGLVRKHGPRGYANYDLYRPWLRDDFVFRCVYCLDREQWGRAIGQFNIDHFIPQATDPARALDYDNLVYTCARCNLIKSGRKVHDPTTALTADNLRIQPDGELQCYDAAAESLVLELDLNSPTMISWRLMWMRILELARERDPSLYRRLLGYPADLPNLSRLKPPHGNSRPAGVKNSHFARAARGELPVIY